MYNDIAAQVPSSNNEAAAMIIADFADETITFEQWADFFKGIQNQEKLEDILERYNFL
jgi:hypothetical protein